MISVLIPAYNFDLTDLIFDLTKQFGEVNCKYEIQIVNDASTKFVNENNKLAELENVSILNLKKNIGRSKIRNLLMSLAKYDWLLFLDADVVPVSSNFIKNYLNQIRKGNEKVICGGVKYQEEIPEENYILRWKYGKQREEIPLTERLKRKNKTFLGANFLVFKDVFSQVHFDESIQGYGYEDVLFMEEITDLKFTVKQIDNPVFHLGLDTNNEYFKKIKQSVQNLFVLINNNKLKVRSIKIGVVYNLIVKMKLVWVFYFLFKKYNLKLEQHLTGSNPNLILLDIYKLLYLCSLRYKT